MIRPATARDAEAIRAVYAPFVLASAVTFDTAVPTVDDVVARMTGTPRLP